MESTFFSGGKGSLTLPAPCLPSWRARELHPHEGNRCSKWPLLCLHANLHTSRPSAAWEQRGYLIFKSLLTSITPGTWKGHYTFSMSGVWIKFWLFEMETKKNRFNIYSDVLILIFFDGKGDICHCCFVHPFLSLVYFGFCLALGTDRGNVQLWDFRPSLND